MHTKSKVLCLASFGRQAKHQDNAPAKTVTHRRRCTEGADEDLYHRFFNYPFTKRCWDKISISWNTNLSMYSRVAHAKQQQNVPFFMEAVTIAAWELWKLRNDKVFRNGRVQLGIWFRNFRNQRLLQSLRFSDDLRSSFCVWLDCL